VAFAAIVEGAVIVKRAVVLALGAGMLACGLALPPVADAAPGETPAKDARLAQRALTGGPRAWVDGASDTTAPGEVSALRASPSVSINDRSNDVDDPQGDLLSASAGADSSSAVFTARVQTSTNPETAPEWAGDTGAVWILDTNYDKRFDYVVVYLRLNGNVAVSMFDPGLRRLCRGTPTWNGVTYVARLGSTCPRLRSFQWTVEFDWDATPSGPNNDTQVDFAPQTTTARPTPLHRVGYWMLGADGKLYNFGNAPGFGGAVANASAAVARPTGTGVWVTNRAGGVFTRGSAAYKGGSPALRFGEFVSSMSALPDGRGYWLFTNLGRALPYGDAKFYGDMRNVRLNGPVIASVATANGKGYYMVGSDGGIFTFGNARFRGSMGGVRLNAPVVGIAPTPDNRGYWLVASDGGVFAFRAPFRGSMGGVRLNKPVNGMVAFGNGYLMVASDGGVFTFSNKPFLGSLGGKPLSAPIIGITAFSV
jgi:hypothetical protein